jgi:HEPN domain-containing protein
MARKSDTAEVLLAHAAEDELASRSLLSVEGITDSAIGFHAQQAVEKSIKAVLSARQIEYPYVHDIDGLIELAQSNGIEVPIELSDADYLTPFAVRLRYGAAPTADLDCDQALRWAAAAVDWARLRVEPAKDPSTQPQSAELKD